MGKDIAVLVARLIFAAAFIMAATFKFLGMQDTAGYIAAAGFPFPLFLAWVAALFEVALILGSGLVLLAGIAWAIVSDARSKAPVKDAEIGHPGAGPVRHNRSQKQRECARAKAKTGRRQRKRNRGRR